MGLKILGNASKCSDLYIWKIGMMNQIISVEDIDKNTGGVRN